MFEENNSLSLFDYPSDSQNGDLTEWFNSVYTPADIFPDSPRPTPRPIANDMDADVWWMGLSGQSSCAAHSNATQDSLSPAAFTEEELDQFLDLDRYDRESNVRWLFKSQVYVQDSLCVADFRYAFSFFRGEKRACRAQYGQRPGF